MSTENTTILIPVDTEKFWAKMREIVHDEVSVAKIPSQPVYTVDGLKQKPIYRAKELCQLLGISRQTLFTWIKDGLLKQYKIKSRSFFLWADVEKLINGPSIEG